MSDIEEFREEARAWLEANAPKGVYGVQPSELGGLKVTQFDTLDGIRFRLADGSWLLIRFSISDSMVRFYAEASSLSHAEMLLQVARDLSQI